MKRFMAIATAFIVAAVIGKAVKDSQENKRTWEEATDKIS